MRSSRLVRVKTAESLTFLLVPDAGAARRVRRLIAGRHACAGVVVGTCAELTDLARRTYLIPEPEDDWDLALADALRGLNDAFWVASFDVAPVETTLAVGQAMAALLAATDPATGLAVDGTDRLAARLRRHLTDLKRLAEVLGTRLPPELATIRDLLAADCRDALRPVRVIAAEGVPALSRWQIALVAKLNRDAGDVPEADESIAAILDAVLRPGAATAQGALGVLQSRLYQPVDQQAALDDSVQWLGVRDFLQEAEVAAGLVQRMLADDPTLAPSDIGLLLPDEFEYAVAVEDAFRLAGLALSGLPAERWRRDLGREAVFHFVYCRQKPAPAMALAVVLSSPLMPWSREDGAVLAQAVMEGSYELKPPKGASTATRQMLDLLREGDTDPATLDSALQRLATLIDGGEEFAAHAHEARAAVQALRALLADARHLDWTALRRATTPRLITGGQPTEFNLEGVTVWRAGQEPWRPIRTLIVLGFAQGRYPDALGRNPVFPAEDLETIVECTGLAVTTPAGELAIRRARFRRQLAAVRDAVRFLVPRRDATGKALSPSESLVFMHQLFAGPEAAEELVVDLDAADGRALARGVAFATPASPTPPRALPIEDLQFGRDLVALRKTADGTPKPESPSSLETLMVSRLTWLLRRLDAEPIEWAPEEPGPALLGTLAHDVFEGLFAPGAALPDRDAIPDRVEALVDDALGRVAPFLRAASWSVERRHFVAQTVKAAQAWRDVLGGLGAEVIAAEEWLTGQWADIAVHGQTDLILGLPGRRLLVVDYKRSKSASRLKQMKKGFDSQASLYRAMLESGGPKNADNVELAVRLRAATEVGVVYYLMNDQAVLSDVAPPGAAGIAGWEAVGGDIASEALRRIEQHLAEVRQGRVVLNRAGDADFFEKEAGIKPYALEASPLTSLFTLPDPEPST